MRAEDMNHLELLYNRRGFWRFRRPTTGWPYDLSRWALTRLALRAMLGNIVELHGPGKRRVRVHRHPQAGYRLVVHGQATRRFSSAYDALRAGILELGRIQ